MELISKQDGDHAIVVGVYALFAYQLKLKSSKQVHLFVELARNLSLLVAHRLFLKFTTQLDEVTIRGFERDTVVVTSPTFSSSSGTNVDALPLCLLVLDVWIDIGKANYRVVLVDHYHNNLPQRHCPSQPLKLPFSHRFGVIYAHAITCCIFCR